MLKAFILKNRRGEKIGEIIFSNKRFEVKVSLKEEKEKFEKLLDFFAKNGISDLGEVILKKPIKINDPLFFNEIRNQLAKRGYILTEKEK
jgi:hypothetical protein